MAAWAMLIGMVTLINVTMVAAIMQLAGSIPDGSLLVILSRYLKGKKEPPDALLHPLEASARLQRLRRRATRLAAAAALTGAGFAVWALAAGWGFVAMAALTLWVLAGNVAFLAVPLASFKRRTGRMDLGTGEGKARNGKPLGGNVPRKNKERGNGPRSDTESNPEE